MQEGGKKMKRSKWITVLATLLACSFLFSACSSSNKTSRRTTASEEETEESTQETTEPVVPTINVSSLDQFLSDGSLFAEDVPVPTPTPIPVKQTKLGMENNGKGYFSGMPENATIIETKYFRYTIFDIKKTDTSYEVNGEFENKSDKAYKITLRNIAIDSIATTSRFFLQDPIEPHTKVPDTTDFATALEGYHGQDFSRISFLILASDPDQSANATIPISDDGSNYVLINLFPQGEDAFKYEEKTLSEDSKVIFDSDGALFSVDGFEYTHSAISSSMTIKYTFVNKTADYIQFKLLEQKIMLDDKEVEIGHQSIYIPPFASLEGNFYVSNSALEGTGINPENVKMVIIPVIANSLTDGIKVLWQKSIKTEVTYV